MFCSPSSGCRRHRPAAANQLPQRRPVEAPLDRRQIATPKKTSYVGQPASDERAGPNGTGWPRRVERPKCNSDRHHTSRPHRRPHRHSATCVQVQACRRAGRRRGRARTPRRQPTGSERADGDASQAENLTHQQHAEQQVDRRRRRDSCSASSRWRPAPLSTVSSRRRSPDADGHHREQELRDDRAAHRRPGPPTRDDPAAPAVRRADGRPARRRQREPRRLEDSIRAAGPAWSRGVAVDDGGEEHVVQLIGQPLDAPRPAAARPSRPRRRRCRGTRR